MKLWNSGSCQSFFFRFDRLLFAWSNIWNMLWTVLQFLGKLESRISMEPRMSVCSSFWTWRILWSHSKSWILRCEGPQHISMPIMPRTASNFSKMLKGGCVSLWQLAFKRTMFQAKMWHFAKTFLGHGLLLCSARWTWLQYIAVIIWAATAGQSSTQAVWRCLSRRSLSVGKMRIWILGLTKMLAFRLRSRGCPRKSLAVKHHSHVVYVLAYLKDAWTFSLNLFLIPGLSIFDTFAFWREDSDVDSLQHVEEELIHPVSWVWLRWPLSMQLRAAKRKNSWSCERIRRLGL